MIAIDPFVLSEDHHRNDAGVGFTTMCLSGWATSPPPACLTNSAGVKNLPWHTHTILTSSPFLYLYKKPSILRPLGPPLVETQGISFIMSLSASFANRLTPADSFSVPETARLVLVGGGSIAGAGFFCSGKNAIVVDGLFASEWLFDPETLNPNQQITKLSNGHEALQELIVWTIYASEQHAW